MSDDTTPDLLGLMAEALTASFTGHPHRRHQALAANRVLAERMWPPVQAALDQRDASLTESRTARDSLRNRIRELERANTSFQEINTIRTAERDQLKAEVKRLKAAIGPAVNHDEPCGNREPADRRLTCTLREGHLTHYAAGSGTAWTCICAPTADQAAVARVRALHVNEHGSCGGCMDVLSVSWPCPTIAALDQPEEGTG